MGKRKNRIGLVLDDRICDYGCGGKAYFQFNNGRVCCSLCSNKCNYYRKQISESCKGIVKSDETRRRLSIVNGGTGEKPASQLCECGCKQLTKPGNKFIFGHARRKHFSKLCECGCGQFAKPGRRFISGHNTRVFNPKLLESKRKELFLGKQLCYYGCGRLAHYRFNNGILCCCLTIQGCPTIKRKIGKANRFRLIERIEEQIAEGGQAHPTYNFNACEFFKQFDKDFNVRGLYATNGGEYYIKELGYWPDYINFDLKLIIEWDEENHYNADGNLKAKDVQRQKEIQKYFSDFRFIRIREKFQGELDYSFMEAGKQE